MDPILSLWGEARMEPITYTTVPGNLSAESYYLRVEALADEVVAVGFKSLKPIIDVYASQTRHTSFDQICLELLLLGVYARRGSAGKHPSMAQLDYVLALFENAGDYDFQSLRLRKWQLFLLKQPPKVRDFFWELIGKLVDWFEKRGTEVLGSYTQQVEHYLSVNKLKDSDKDDAFFCASPVVEYHLNMVGAEILNKVFYAGFQTTKQRLVVLPGCLRSNSLCQATEWILGNRCQHCTQGCQISEITNLGAKWGFQVSFVIHQSTLRTQIEGLKRLTQGTDYGILGVACVLSLLEGGFLLESHHVSAQCVPLNFCGCSNHWHEEGITTAVSVKRLLEKVGCGYLWAQGQG